MILDMCIHGNPPSDKTIPAAVRLENGVFREPLVNCERRGIARRANNPAGIFLTRRQSAPSLDPDQDGTAVRVVIGLLVHCLPRDGL